MNTKNTIPLVSICVPTYNRSRLLARAIRSCSKQTYENIEIIISDNCSSDDTASVCAKACSDDRRVRYYRQDHNIGAYENRQFLISVARGSFVFILADDDDFELSAIESLLAEFTKRPEAVCITSYFIECKTDGSEIKRFDFNEYLTSQFELVVGTLHDFASHSALSLFSYGLYRTEALRKLPQIKGFRLLNGARTLSGTEIVFLRNLYSQGKVFVVPRYLIRYTGPGPRDGAESQAVILAENLGPVNGFFLLLQQFLFLQFSNFKGVGAAYIFHVNFYIISFTFVKYVLWRCTCKFVRFLNRRL
jgi:glycosyltransferase involved in cell wall biosynthesis